MLQFFLRHFLIENVRDVLLEGSFSPSTPLVDAVNPLPTVLLWSYLADAAMTCGVTLIGECWLGAKRRRVETRGDSKDRKEEERIGENIEE